MIFDNKNKTALAKFAFIMGIIAGVILTILFVPAYQPEEQNLTYINNGTYVIEQHELKHFINHQELYWWVFTSYEDDTPYVENEYDCEDFAMEFQRQALEDGYIVSVSYNENYTHAFNTAIIPSENRVYRIEPRAKYITVVCGLDAE